MLLGADRFERVELFTVFAAAASRREGERRVRAAGLERLEHLFLLHACGLRQLRDGRGTSELHGELLDNLRKLDIELLQAARNSYRPALVPEVALDLAD